MAQLVRYRTGIDRRTGGLLRGAAHLSQSLAEIWTTRTGIRVMLLEFGSNLRDLLAEDVTQSLALQVYREIVTSAHRWEPEARISHLQLVYLTKLGALGLEYGGTYYPEGRFGNYALVEPLAAVYPVGQRISAVAA